MLLNDKKHTEFHLINEMMMELMMMMKKIFLKTSSTRVIKGRTVNESCGEASML